MKNTTPAFISRTPNAKDEPCRNTPRDAANYSDILKAAAAEITSRHPANRITPNSIIYKKALDQLAKKLVYATLVRPDVPDWFCGKIRATLGEFDGTVDDETRRYLKDVSTYETPYQSTTSISITSTNYDVDPCLVFGPPGSYEYTLCPGDSSEAMDTVLDDLNSYILGTITESEEGGEEEGGEEEGGAEGGEGGDESGSSEETTSEE